MPRFLDDPRKRVADIYSAVDYLTSLRYVDVNRIGALASAPAAAQQDQRSWS